MRILPLSQSREDVTRHVQRVRSRRRDLHIGLRGRQSLRRQFRIVVGVDQVVWNPWMLRVLLEEWLQYLRRDLLPRVRLVGRRSVAQQRQGVEHLHLDVLAIHDGKISHGSFVVRDAPGIRNVRTVEEQRRGIHESTLAIRSAAGFLGFRDLLCSDVKARFREGRFP